MTPPPSTKSEREWPTVTIWRLGESGLALTPAEALRTAGSPPALESHRYLPRQHVERLIGALEEIEHSDDPTATIEARRALRAFKEASER